MLLPLAGVWLAGVLAAQAVAAGWGVPPAVEGRRFRVESRSNLGAAGTLQAMPASTGRRYRMSDASTRHETTTISAPAPAPGGEIP